MSSRKVIRKPFRNPVLDLDLVDHLYEQMEWSEKTFGIGHRTQGVIDHIKKELKEIEFDPGSLEEWIDVVMLALDGAWRAGYAPEEVAGMLHLKFEKNKNRNWPDWRTAPSDKAIEHIREEQS